MRRPIKLRKDLRERINRALLLKDHHMQLAQQQERLVVDLLQVAYGINLAVENWQLDEEHGLLIPQGTQDS